MGGVSQSIARAAKSYGASLHTDCVSLLLPSLKLVLEHNNDFASVHQPSTYMCLVPACVSDNSERWMCCGCTATRWHRGEGQCRALQCNSKSDILRPSQRGVLQRTLWGLSVSYSVQGALSREFESHIRSIDYTSPVTKINGMLFSVLGSISVNLFSVPSGSEWSP